jgi:uncharacterized membrane protein YkvA (DUF1232 family)
MLRRLRNWADIAQRDAHAAYLAAFDPRVPWYAKVLALAAAAYAFSPIDLIPDFIPVIGQLDDILVVALGIALVVKLIPPEIMAEHRAAALAARERPKSKAMIAAVVAVWILAAAVFGYLVLLILGYL